MVIYKYLNKTLLEILFKNINILFDDKFKYLFPMK